MIVYLQQRLKNENLLQRTDIIVLSDHGMLTTTPRNFIDLYQFVDRNEVKMYGTSPVLQVVANQRNRQNDVCRQLMEAARNDGRFNAYDIRSLPQRWRISNPQRFGPCVVVADPPCAFQDYLDVEKWYPQVQSKVKTFFILIIAIYFSIQFLI